MLGEALRIETVKCLLREEIRLMLICYPAFGVRCAKSEHGTPRQQEHVIFFLLFFYFFDAVLYALVDKVHKD